MNAHDARKAAAKLAEADPIALTAHARERNRSAGREPLTREQIRNCLIRGDITEGPVRDIREDGWKLGLTRMRRPERHEVSCVLLCDRLVLIITGYEYQKRSR